MTDQTAQQPDVQSESSNLNWEVPKLTLHNFDDIADKVHKLEDLRMDPEKVNPRGRGLVQGVNDDLSYDVVDLKALRFNSMGSVFVPGFGNLEMTPHAMKQLGSELGVRWPKFFGHMMPDQIQQAVTNHLRTRTNPTLKRIIARKHGADSILSELNPHTRKIKSPLVEEKISTDGVLRGFVGPNYSEIRDARMFDRIHEVAEPGQLDDMGFALFSFRDNGSHFMLVQREPVDLLTAQPMGGRISEGGRFGRFMSASVGAGAANGAFFGIRIRNSEVGSYALSANPYFVRFVCVNGVIVAIKEEPLLYRQHRGVSDRELDRIIERMYKVLPERQKEIIDNNRKLHAITIENPEEEINNFLSTQSKMFRENAIKAYNEEPVPTAYGIMQALARVAMASRRDMDRQLDIETLAGNYMRKTLSRHSS
jgi:hypothetical protein